MSQKNEPSSEGVPVLGWLDFVKEGLLGHAQSVVTTLLEKMERGVAGITKRVLYRSGVFFLSLLGVSFLIFGVAEIFDQIFEQMFGRQGLGKIAVGGGISVLVLLLATFEKNLFRN